MGPKARRQEEEYARQMGDRALERQVTRRDVECTCRGRTHHSHECPVAGEQLRRGRR